MRNPYATKARSKRERIFRQRLQKDVSALVEAIVSSKEFSHLSESRSTLKREIEGEIIGYIKDNKRSFFSKKPEPAVSEEEIIKSFSERGAN